MDGSTTRSSSRFFDIVHAQRARVTMQATVTGEDVIDAMDLRAFDTNKRTWIKELHYARRDYLMLGLGAAIFVACCLLKWVFGVGEFFVPDFFFKLLGY